METEIEAEDEARSAAARDPEAAPTAKAKAKG